MQSIDEILKFLKGSDVNIQKLSKESGIAADRLYSWRNQRGKPKTEDSEKLLKWAASFGTNSNNDFIANEPPPTYQTKRFNLKINPLYEPIPVHDIDIPAGNYEMSNDKNETAVDYYYIPEFSGTRAFNVYSDSMEPLISKGAKIFAKKIEEWNEYLELGQVYSVGMNDGRRFLKYIKKGSTVDRFLLVSENNHYDDFEIPKNKIRSVWLIDGWMNKQTQSTFFVLNK